MRGRPSATVDETLRTAPIRASAKSTVLRLSPMPPPSIDDHVTQLRQELQSQYDQLTTRIEALQKDLGRALDGEQKVVLEQRLQDLAAERERLVEQMAFLDQHADEIRAGKIDLPGLPELEPAPGPEPYKGLQVFDVADAAGFFGRERLTAELVEFVRHNSLLAVVGASGSGKSSLVRAGLVSALQTGQPLPDGTTPPAGSAAWPVHIITPSSRPLESLAASLTPASEPVTAIARLIDDLANDPRSLHLTVRRLLSQSPKSPTHLLLIVDQFEELFTLCKDKAQRKAFVDNLLAAACPDPDGSCQPAETSTLVVLTLRADFYAQCSEFDNLRLALERYQRYIGAMSKQELQAAIEEPARRGGWELEPGLVDVLLQDVGDEPGALPLLSHALLETWQRRRGRVLTLAGYMASGRVQGALAKTADAVYQRGLTPEQQPIARGIFLRLTELGEGAPDTRRRVSLRELIPQNETAASVRSVLKTLADARLVTLDRDEAEVAHEALIREWPALQEWLAQDREGLRVHRRLTEAAREWEQNGRDEGYLYRGSQLAQAEEWVAQHSGDPNQWERAFLDASLALRSREAEEREAQRERELADARKIAQSAVRLRRWALLAAAIGVIALIFAAVAAGFGVQSGRNANVAERVKRRHSHQAEAEQQTRRARAGELAASSLNEWAKTRSGSIPGVVASQRGDQRNSQPGWLRSAKRGDGLRYQPPQRPPVAHEPAKTSPHMIRSPRRSSARMASWW